MILFPSFSPPPSFLSFFPSFFFFLKVTLKITVSLSGYSLIRVVPPTPLCPLPPFPCLLFLGWRRKCHLYVISSCGVKKILMLKTIQLSLVSSILLVFFSDPPPPHLHLPQPSTPCLELFPCVNAVVIVSYTKVFVQTVLWSCFVLWICPQVSFAVVFYIMLSILSQSTFHNRWCFILLRVFSVHVCTPLFFFFHWQRQSVFFCCCNWYLYVEKGICMCLCTCLPPSSSL